MSLFIFQYVQYVHISFEKEKGKSLWEKCSLKMIPHQILWRVIHPELKTKTAKYHGKLQSVLRMMEGYQSICILMYKVTNENKDNVSWF